MNSLELAKKYLSRGWSVVPLRPGLKKPLIPGWPNLRITDGDVGDYFTSDNYNVGVILGPSSNNLVDVDCDCDEAEVIAPHFLPPTDAVFGRPSKPRLHFLYYSDVKKAAKHYSIEKETMIELRANKQQTMFPGSLHLSGEIVEWSHEGEPATVLASVLEDAVSKVAACCLLAKAWRTAKGSRHDLALTIAGGLKASGWSADEAVRFVVSAANAAGDNEIEDRERAVIDTFESSEEKLRGWSSAGEIIGQRVMKRMRDLLGAGLLASIDASFALGLARVPNNGETLDIIGADGQGSGLPVIVTSTRHATELADEAVAALIAANEPPVTFIWSGALCRVRVRNTAEGPAIESLDDNRLRERLGWVARFVTRTQKAFVPTNPPSVMVSDINNRPGWPGLPVLQGVTQTPILRPDGSILSTPGYDIDTCLYYEPPPGFVMPDIPDEPTREQVASAIGAIVNILFEIKFKTQADRANVIALLLTPPVRTLVDLVPLAVIDAPIHGSGKTMITDIVSIIAKGEITGKEGVPKENEEMDKRITASLMAGASFIVFDDVTYLRSNALHRALTSPYWSGRRLGHSERVVVPQRATWMVTGNNVELKDELARRCFWIRLDPEMSRPWLRGGFAIPQLVQYVRDHRAELLAALLTLIRAWYVAGQPKAKTEPIGSFGQWCRLIGGILEHVGIPGFLENKEALYDQSDDETGQWENFIQACHEIFRDKVVTVSELVLEIQSFSSPITLALPDYLAEARGPNQRQDFKKTLGKALAKRADRIFGSYKIERAGQHSNRKVALWKFVKNEN